MLNLTYHVKCDKCGKVETFQYEAVTFGSMPSPGCRTVSGLDVCPDCLKAIVEDTATQYGWRPKEKKSTDRSTH